MWRAVVLVVAAAPEFDLQRRVVDAEAFVQILAHGIDEGVVIRGIRAHQVRGHRDLARAQRPDVDVVHRGDAVIAPGMTRRLLDHVAPLLSAPQVSPDEDVARRIASLSAREHEVFLLMAAARSNAEIATELFLSETTVKTHVAHVLDKLGARDRVQAAVLAYEAGVVTPGDRTAVIDRPTSGPATQGRP